ncbi:MAG TPA: glycosyltransferase family 1 protein [Acidimicrobiales bacterium]|nr:glycosyltransferase family 1 protein [Acidimicrobiales bacterium]
MPAERLRVAVDATPLLGVRTGVGVFCEWALACLARREELEMSAFAVSWRRRGGIRAHLPAGVRMVDRPMPARPLHRAWGLGSLPPVEWWTGPEDVVHGTNFVVPPTRRAARVVTVHDLTAVRFPEMCDDYTRTFPRLVRRALADGAWVHTPSQFVAAEVVDLLGARPDRVVAVHHGIPLDPGQGTGTDALPVAARGAPYVLALGTVEPRKDLPTLVRAFDAVAADVPGLRLVVAGPEGWGEDAFAGAVQRTVHRDRVVRLGWVGGDERAALLRNAAVYVYPSLYEGFGFPPLEAMVAGVPVVTTTAGALPEVVGDGAELVGPGDADALAAAVRVLATDPSAREAAVARGRARAGRFSWDRTAAGLSDLYRRAAAGR